MNETHDTDSASPRQPADDADRRDSVCRGEEPSPRVIDEIERGQRKLGHLLAQLSRAAGPATSQPDAAETTRYENQLAMVRLGIATSLYYALRIRHPPTAAHGLRVALACSAWCQHRGLSSEEQDRIEIAALLHDVGKIGIPDRILRKPGKLTVDEQLTMDACPELSCQILSGCTDDRDLLDIVRYANVWYESRRADDEPRGETLPLGSRMLAIAGSFDAITTDHVYRPARSRERALQEIAAGSGTQFDPELAIDFTRTLEQRPELLQGRVVDRWLRELDAAGSAHLWQPGGERGAVTSEALRERLFYGQLSESLYDGVVFTDNEGTVTHWNAAMERLTSIKAEAILGRGWGDEIVRLRNDDASREEDGCPVAECLRLVTCISKPMVIEQPGGEPTPVHVKVTPVSGPSPGNRGTVVVIRDLSDQADLKQQLVSLHQQATRDPLTGVANRAEFDQSSSDFVTRARDGGATFSLIICDIDHFKRINDRYGHPAGDEALVQFAGVLDRQSRDGDLVARYGGEEFILLCARCDNATATHRAETMRAAIERTPLPSLGGESVTASFGVTEFQTGDSAETLLARADRALLRAKDNGRNRVVQLGSGYYHEPSQAAAKRGWFRWFEPVVAGRRSEVDIVTPVPIEIAIEKLRGFIADHNAEIVSTNEDQVTLRVRSVESPGGRRAVDHRVTIQLELTLSELVSGKRSDPPQRRVCQTNVHASLQPIRHRDRRRRELKNSLNLVIASLRSYLMGEIITPSRHEA